MTRQYCRIQRLPLALCGLLAPALLAGCGLEKILLPPIEQTLASIKDTIDPMPPPKVDTGAQAARRAKPRAQTAMIRAGRCNDVPSCEILLRKMTEGPDRSWITRPDTPEGLLTGVRMFAFRTLRPKLTCPDLAAALEQLRGVPAALRPPPAGSSPEDIARTTRLAAEVHDELRAENELRCRAATTPPSRPPAPPPAAPPQPPSQSPAPPAQPQQPQVTIPDQPQGRPEKQ